MVQEKRLSEVLVDFARTLVTDCAASGSSITEENLRGAAERGAGGLFGPVHRGVGVMPATRSSRPWPGAYWPSPAGRSSADGSPRSPRRGPGWQ